jgi:CRP-like cAMP-binding protein
VFYVGMAVDVDDLADVPVLAGLDQAHRDELAEWFDLEEVGDGRHITRQGSSGYAFYVVRSGRFTVEHDDQVVGRLERGAHFGEISILGDGRRSATVTADGDGSLLVLFGTRFRELQVASPEVAAALESSMRARLDRDAADG